MFGQVASLHVRSVGSLNWPVLHAPEPASAPELEPVSVAPELEPASVVVAELEPASVVVAELEPASVVVAELEPASVVVPELDPASVVVPDVEPASVVVPELDAVSVAAPELDPASLLAPELEPVSVAAPELEPASAAPELDPESCVVVSLVVDVSLAVDVSLSVPPPVLPSLPAHAETSAIAASATTVRVIVFICQSSISAAKGSHARADHNVFSRAFGDPRCCRVAALVCSLRAVAFSGYETPGVTRAHRPIARQEA